MSKQQYMHDLWDALDAFGDDVRDEIIEDYEEHFKDGLEKGKTEDQIVEELGSIDDLVAELKELRGDNEKKEEKTDSKNDFESKAESFEKYTKSFASAIGTLAATISNEAGKIFDSAVNGTSNFTGTVVNMGEKVAEKSVDFAKEVRDSFNSKMSENAESERTSASASFTETKNMILEVQVGNVVVKDSSDGALHVDYKNYGTANQLLAYKFDYSEKDGTAYVSVKKQPGVTNFFRALAIPRIVVTVELPANFGDIKIHSLAGNISVSNVSFNDADITAMAGNIDFAYVKANDIEARSMAGNVSFEEESANMLHCRTNAGNASVSGAVKEIGVSSNAGDVKINCKDCEKIEASTTAGNIKIALEGIKGYEADANTCAGNVKMAFGEAYVKGSHVGKYVMGDGSVKITAKTSAGNIKIAG